jgi:NDP-sugar pyrophosphorylase family protein
VARAIVLAGGEGVRLRPYTAVIPKPLMPLGDRPVLEIVLHQLREAGFERVTICTGYLASLIEAFFGDGSGYGIPIDYVQEREPLGTVGALALMHDLDQPFLLMNGDIVTDLSYAELMARHVASGASLTIAATTRRVEVSLGVLETLDASAPDRVTGFVEKPKIDFEASMGVYGMSPDAVDFVEPGIPLDFPELVKRLIAAGRDVRAWTPDAYWLDIGRHDDYETAMNEFERMRHRLIPGEPPGRGQIRAVGG